MSTKMNRRTFLKTTAAAAVAVSMTGLLGGCDGDNGFDVGEYRVYFDVQDYYPSGATGKAYVVLNVTVKGVSNTLTLNKKFSDNFEADGFTLTNGNEKLNVMQGMHQVCNLKFEKTTTEGFDAMTKGETPFVLTVKLSNANKVFAINLKTRAVTVKS